MTGTGWGCNKEGCYQCDRVGMQKRRDVTGVYISTHISAWLQATVELVVFTREHIYDKPIGVLP